MKPDPTALIIDSERAVRRLLCAVLKPQGFEVIEADSGGAGLSLVVECKPDVIILEVVLVDGSGVEILETLREWNCTPVLVLSEKSDDETKIAALDAGASDYLTKPFSSRELLARLRVLLRPLPHVPDGPLLIEGDLIVNLATPQIKLAGCPIELTPKEEALFYVLVRYAGKVVTRVHLLNSVWGAHSQDNLHDLTVLVGHLRKKLGSYGEQILIKTEDSVGYRLLLPDQWQRALCDASSASSDAPFIQ